MEASHEQRRRVHHHRARGRRGAAGRGARPGRGRCLPPSRARDRRTHVGPAVPEGLGQPDLPAAGGRPGPGTATATVRPCGTGAHDMGREYKALSRLWRAYPPAPRALAFCDDESVLGARFFVMEYRPGVVIWDALPESMAGLPDCGRRVGLAVVDALADLHQVDPYACDLGNLGRPDGFVARQLEGWRARWDWCARLTGCRRWTRPAPPRPHPARPAAGVDPPQRPEGRQLPVRPDRPRPRPVGVRLGHGDPGRPAGRLRHPPQLLAGSFRPPRRPGRLRRRHGAHRPAHQGRDHRPLRQAHRPRCERRHLVRGLRVLEGRGGAPAALRPLPAGETTDPRMATRGERVAELAARSLRLVRRVTA